jgi:hypothetical protein
MFAWPADDDLMIGEMKQVLSVGSVPSGQRHGQKRRELRKVETAEGTYYGRELHLVAL